MTKHFSNCLKYASLINADDTSIFIKGKTASLLFAKGNQELRNIDDWLIAHKLSPNLTSTKLNECTSKPPALRISLAIMY